MNATVKRLGLLLLRHSPLHSSRGSRLKFTYPHPHIMWCRCCSTVLYKHRSYMCTVVGSNPGVDMLFRHSIVCSIMGSTEHNEFHIPLRFANGKKWVLCRSVWTIRYWCCPFLKWCRVCVRTWHKAKVWRLRRLSKKFQSC